MLDRVRIRTLRDAGHTLEEIAATVGVGKRSVQRVVKEPAIEDAESAPTPASRGVGRPSTVEVYQDQVERILKEESSLPTVEVLSRLRGLGYTGGKSAVYELVKAIRPPKTESPEVRFEWCTRRVQPARLWRREGHLRRWLQREGSLLRLASQVLPLDPRCHRAQ